MRVLVLRRFRTAARLATGVVAVVYQAEVHDGTGCAHFALFARGVGFFGLALEPVVFDLFGARDLLGVMETLEVVLLGTDAVRGRVGLGVTLLELLPEGKAARSSAFEAESGLSRLPRTHHEQ